MSERINLHQLNRKNETIIRQRMMNIMIDKSEYGLLRLCKLDQKAFEVFFHATQLISKLQEKTQGKLNKKHGG